LSPAAKKLLAVAELRKHYPKAGASGRVLVNNMLVSLGAEPFKVSPLAPHMSFDSDPLAESKDTFVLNQGLPSSKAVLFDKFKETSFVNNEDTNL